METDIENQGYELSIQPQKPEYFLTFMHIGEPVGVLKIKDGILSFEGNVDESAKIFFSTVIEDLQLFIDQQNAN